MRAPRVLLVTDPRYEDLRIEEVIGLAGRALPPGALGVLLRDKLREGASLASFARRLRDVTAASGAALFVHTDTALALAVRADGVHLAGRALEGGASALREARRALPLAWISVAAHEDEDVVRAAAAGADAVLVSPIFETPGKGPARGTAAITRAREIAPALAIYALGGVDAARAAACERAGASGVAVIRALLAAKDPAEVARELARAHSPQSRLA